MNTEESDNFAAYLMSKDPIVADLVKLVDKKAAGNPGAFSPATKKISFKIGCGIVIALHVLFLVIVLWDINNGTSGIIRLAAVGPLFNRLFWRDPVFWWDPVRTVMIFLILEVCSAVWCFMKYRRAAFRILWMAIISFTVISAFLCLPPNGGVDVDLSHYAALFIWPAAILGHVCRIWRMLMN